MDPEMYAHLPLWKKACVRLDQAIERSCGYDGPAPRPEGAVGQLWLDSALRVEGPTPAQRAEHYAQDQLDIPITGRVECVTTSAVIARNIVKDHILSQLSLALSDEPDLSVVAFAEQSNAAGLSGWKFRLPSRLPLVGGFMHPTLQLPHLLDAWSEALKARYHVSFSHTYSSHNRLGDLLENLSHDRLTLIHGVWDNTLVNPYDGSFHFEIATLLGGIPHTMPLVMYDASADLWWFYNLGWKHQGAADAFSKLSTADFMKFWGRHYILNTYTAPFAMTTLTLP
jgi:hypothetical protein